jgi:hypothetical protein
MEVNELGMGEEIDKIVDMSAQSAPGALQSKLIPMLE